MTVDLATVTLFGAAYVLGYASAKIGLVRPSEEDPVLPRRPPGTIEPDAGGDASQEIVDAMAGHREALESIRRPGAKEKDLTVVPSEAEHPLETSYLNIDPRDEKGYLYEEGDEVISKSLPYAYEEGKVFMTDQLPPTEH